MNKITARTKRKIVQNIVGYLYVAPVILGVLFFIVQQTSMMMRITFPSAAPITKASLREC